jgi:hypothetical protein
MRVSRPQLPAPKNAAATARDKAATAASTAYDDALARKKNPKHMAAALFEKQLQTRRAEASKLAEDEQSAGDVVPQSSHDSFDNAAPAASSWTGGSSTPQAAGAGQAVGEAPALPEGWGAAWDATANAFYYYTSSGHTQWEPPVSAHLDGHGADKGNALDDDPSLPEELRRELKKQARRGGGGGLETLAARAPVVTTGDLWNGEKHQEYTSMAAAFHVPMNVVPPPSGSPDLAAPACLLAASLPPLPPAVLPPARCTPRSLTRALLLVRLLIN